MQNYEITYLRADEEADSAVKKIIDELGGKSQQVEYVGKKRLVYPIAKQDVCHFYTIRFSIAGKNIITVSNLVKELPEIVRYIIVSKKTIKVLTPEVKADTKPVVAEEIKTIEPKQEEKKTVRKTTIKEKVETATEAKADKKTTTKKEKDTKTVKKIKKTESSGEQDKERLATLNEKLDELLKE